MQELVHSIESLENFNEVLAAEKGIVVIKFYASFCRACKTMAPKFRQLASHHDQEAMTFAQIELLVSVASFISHFFRFVSLSSLRIASPSS